MCQGMLLGWTGRPGRSWSVAGGPGRLSRRAGNQHAEPVTQATETLLVPHTLLNSLVLVGSTTMGGANPGPAPITKSGFITGNLSSALDRHCCARCGDEPAPRTVGRSLPILVRSSRGFLIAMRYMAPTCRV